MTWSRHAVSGLQQASHLSRRYAKIPGFTVKHSPVPELSFLPALHRGWTRAGEKRVQDNLHAHAQNEPIKNYHAACVNVSCNTMPFNSSRSKKKHFLWRRDCGKKNQNKLKGGLSWSTLLSTTSTRLYSFPKHSGLAKICFVIFDIIFDIVLLSLIYCQDLLTIAHFGKEW